MHQQTCLHLCIILVEIRKICLSKLEVTLEEHERQWGDKGETEGASEQEERWTGKGDPLAYTALRTVELPMKTPQKVHWVC